MASRPSTPAPITYVKASCHCGLNEFRAGFPTNALPISNDLCHCNSCRHSSGQMAVYHVNVVSLLCADSDETFHVEGTDGCPSPVGDGDLVAYRTSDNAVRYFCSSCSSHLVFRYLGAPKEGGEEGEREGGYWCVAAGALERTEGIVKVGYHIWVEDTLDGGLADHFRTLEGTQLPRYRRGPGTEELPLGWKAKSLLERQSSSKDGSLHFNCHCRTVQFKVTPPNDLSTIPHAAYPDFIYPYDITHLAKLRNSADVKWWLRPLNSPNPTKYLAGHCACTYCRLTSGFELQSWVYVPLGNLLDLDGKPIWLQEPEHDDLSEVQAAMERLGVPTSSGKSSPQPPLERTPGLKQYISSPGRYREFCQKCGATVFAWQAGRPNLICVALGLIDEQQDGARAESWFDWCLTRVGFGEQALSVKTVEGLTAGMLETQKEKQTVSLKVSEGHIPTTNPTLHTPAAVDIRTKDGTPEVIARVEEVEVTV